MLRWRPSLSLTALALTVGFALSGCGPRFQEPSSVAPAPVPTGVEEPPAALPTPVTTATAPVVPVPLPTSGALPAPALLESRRLTLEFPHKIRVGDTDVVRLTIEVDELGGLTPTVEVAGHTSVGETVQIPNLYETHTIYADARLDIAGIQIEPANLQSDTLLSGRSLSFYWSLRPPEAGVYRGAVNLHLRFEPLMGGAEDRMLLWSQVIEIRAARFLGLSGGPARLVGTIGSVVSAVLGFPFFEDILRWFFRRSRPKKPNSRGGRKSARRV